MTSLATTDLIPPLVMPPRRITDTTGVTWDLWEVDASTASATGGQPADIPAASDTPAPLQGGWLTARNNEQRRRIAPVPTDWMFMTDTDLRRLVERAREVPVIDERRTPRDEVIASPPSPAPRTLVRSFNDAAGVRWDVWMAHPMLHDRREARDRRTTPRGSPDRRTVQISGYGRGWLVFRSGAIRHRLHAIPSGWHRFSDVDLRLLLVRAARPSGATQRWSD
jgi:hypothetical protein